MRSQGRRRQTRRGLHPLSQPTINGTRDAAEWDDPCAEFQLRSRLPSNAYGPGPRAGLHSSARPRASTTRPRLRGRLENRKQPRNIDRQTKENSRKSENGTITTSLTSRQQISSWCHAVCLILRKTVGDDAKIAVDANQIWSVPEAIKWMEQLAEFNIHWIEEPTSPDDVLGHLEISKALQKYGN